MGGKAKTTEQFKEEMKIKNPNVEILEEYINNENERVGKINYNKYGSEITIVEYYSFKDIDVQFEDGYIEKGRRYDEFIRGSIISPYDKSVFGIGYLGEGKYKASCEYKNSKHYTYWHSMMQRCYDKKYKERQATYRDVICCEEWLNFQIFSKWYEENYYEIDNEKICLDKDILHKGNKIYSPTTCIFVPSSINNLFVKNNKNRGDLPIGIHYSKERNTYIAHCRNNFHDKIIYIGSYDTPEEAFYKGYKPFKEKVIKEVADYYKDKIPKKLYDALYNWKIEITD